MRARIRSVKPEILSDEKLWDLGVESGLPVFQAFQGLWMYADREGRFEWRPRALGPLILPFWQGDFSRVLDALESRGFLRFYRVGSRDYGVVTNFLRHQVPNNKESASVIPEPPEFTGYSTRESRVDDATCTRAIPPSLQKESLGNGREGKGTEENPDSDEPNPAAAEPLPLLPHEHYETPEPRARRGIDPVFAHWLSVMGKDTVRTKLTGDRISKLKARRRDGYTDEQLCRAVDGCRRSDFHMGQNDRNEPYNDLATILKDGKTVEAHIARSDLTRLAMVQNAAPVDPDNPFANDPDVLSGRFKVHPSGKMKVPA
jgi:hypothetical protein